MLRRVAAIPLLSAVWPDPTTATRAAGAPHPARRVRPSDPSWPSAASWEQLNREVGGHLIRVQSPLAVCADAADNAACQEVLRNLKNPYFIGDQPGLTQTSGWVDAWMSAPSAYAVAARNTADVVAAVNFARENNLRLVVKGGGHSYQGTSNAPDSLLIWTRAMNGIVLHDTFVGQGCGGAETPQPAVTVEAGAIWMHVYDAVTTKADRYVQGGGCTTAGVAGLIQSGGFGSFSKNYGMAAAGLVEAEIVTADGAVRIANACSNPELFWGIKGGGGGGLGVVTRLTLRTRELPAWFGIAFLTVRATSDAAFRRLIGRFLSFYSERLFNPHWGESIAFRPSNILAVTMVSQGLDKQQAEDAWRPFLDWIAGSPQDFTLERSPLIAGLPAQHLWDADYMKEHAPGLMMPDQRPGAPAGDVWWAGDAGQVGWFIHGYQSLWLPAAILEKERQGPFADALFAATRHWAVALHFNKGLAGAPPDAVAAAKDTATNPAVLTAFALAIIAGGSAPAYRGIPGRAPDLTSARSDAGAIDRAMGELRKLVPDGGSYVSETNFFESEWQRSFWGANYPRLRAVKATYDPDGLFFIHHGVASEDWSDDGFTRLTGR
jgi:FAD/FMN-containing dehydrogenase